MRGNYARAPVLQLFTNMIRIVYMYTENRLIQHASNLIYLHGRNQPILIFTITRVRARKIVD